MIVHCDSSGVSLIARGATATFSDPSRQGLDVVSEVTYVRLIMADCSRCAAAVRRLRRVVRMIGKPLSSNQMIVRPACDRL